MRLLLIEDEKDIAEPLADGLKKKGFAVDWEDNGKNGLTEAMVNEYDCIILDLNLPDLDGLTIAKELRKENILTPILMLTARTDQDDVLSGFESGSNDYMAKPFNFQELVYRIKSLIKLNSKDKTDIITIDNLQFDLQRSKVYSDKNEIELNKKEFGILEYLARNRGKIVSQEELLEHVWDREIDTLSQTIRTNIKTLRQKIDPDKIIIKNKRGKGYVID